jgi:hypothetical protein
MSRLNTGLRGLAGAIALCSVLAGCGGDDVSTAPTGNSPPPAPPAPPAPPEVVQGVATPSSVSVVTATNAG